MLEFQPELEETMRARYPDALKPIYDLKDVVSGKQSPEKLRKHVFDFFDGVRLVITFERLGYSILTHYVVSIGTPMEFECVGQFMDFIVHHINSIRDDNLVGRVYMVADGKVAHLVVNEVSAKAYLN